MTIRVMIPAWAQKCYFYKLNIAYEKVKCKQKNRGFYLLNAIYVEIVEGVKKNRRKTLGNIYVNYCLFY